MSDGVSELPPVAQNGRVSSPTLVGRVEELATLARIVRTTPSLALIEGEAGVGKTRLVSELLAGSAVVGRRALVGQCQLVREPFPMGPVVDALRSLHTDRPRLTLSAVTGVIGQLLPELAQLLPPPPSPAGDPAAERHRLWRALAELLGALGPTVLVLEDLHWADEATAEFCRFLVSQQQPALSLVLTYRRDDLNPRSPLASIAARLPRGTADARIRLDPLGPGDVRDLIRAILATERVSSEFAEFLHERTGGVPLAVEELLRLLVDRHDLVRLGGRWARRGLEDLNVPDALRDSILERVARLGPDARRLARSASVLSVPASASLLATAAGLSEARARSGLVEAIETGVLQAADRGYWFRHALASQAVYDSIPAPQRQELHARAARALEATDPAPVAQLARHYRIAERPRLWIRYAERAASQAADVGEFDASARLLLDALSAPDLPRATQARLALCLSQAALLAQAQADAIPVLREVLDSGGLEPSYRGDIRYNLAGLLHQSGDASACVREMTKAASELRRSPVARCHALAYLAVPTMAEGDLDEHSAYLSAASALADRYREPKMLSATRIARATLFMAVGHPEAESLVAELVVADGDEMIRACTNIAFNALAVGHYASAEALIERGERVSRQVEASRLDGALAGDRLLLNWFRGRWEGLADAIAGVEEAAVGLPPSLFQTGMLRGLLRLAQGDLDEAEELLQVAVAAARHTGAIPLIGTSATGLARIRAFRGDQDGAYAVAHEAMETIARKDIWAWAGEVAPACVEASIATGRRAEAEATVAELADGLVDRVAPAAEAALSYCRGLVAEAGGQAGRATNWFARAEAAWAALPRPHEAALAAERRGASLAEGGDEKAPLVLLEAMSAFDRVGATWDRDRVQRELRRRGVRLPGRGSGRVGYGRELSPREREVVSLVAEGLTNAEIAQRLFLSTRTVAHHVERIMRKLDVSSRWALREAAI